MEKKIIYMDNAATTPVSESVFREMKPYFIDNFYNISSVYDATLPAKHAVYVARKQVSDAIHARSSEIFFTSGGSESNNWVLQSVVRMFKGKVERPHIITTAIEHDSVLKTCQMLEADYGVDVTYLEPNKDGLISVSSVKDAIRSNTVLISVMMANNEIGVIEPIAEIGDLAKRHNILFHTDAVQCVGHIPIDVHKMHINFLSASGHKFNGPKGIGFLYASHDSVPNPLLFGGSQEFGYRAGTTNVPGIVGLGKALHIASDKINSYMKHVSAMRDYMITQIQTRIPFATLNGSVACRLPNNVNFCFKGFNSEDIIFYLSQNGVCVSSTSACSSGLTQPSHVLKAIGVSDTLSQSVVRFSLSEQNSFADIDFVVDLLCDILKV